MVTATEANGSMRVMRLMMLNDVKNGHGIMVSG